MMITLNITKQRARELAEALDNWQDDIWVPTCLPDDEGLEEEIMQTQGAMAETAKLLREASV